MREQAPPSKSLERWTRWVVRRRWWVIGCWIAIFAVSQVAASGLADLFHSEAALPGTDAQKVENILQDEYGQRSYASFTLVARVDSGEATKVLGPLKSAAQAAARELPTSFVLDPQAVSETVATATITTELDVPEAQKYTESMRAAVADARVRGAQVWLTGSPALASDLQPIFERDLVVGEFFIALPIALLILVFVFGTLAFLLPLLFAFAAIPATLALVWVFAHWMGMEQTVQNLVTFIGLGIAIDYSLLVVYRYREELKATGGAKEQAVLNTMQTAGRAVVFSGTAVAIGLALLILVPVPGIRGYGVAGLLVPLVSIATALTLLPVLLYTLEKPLDRVRLVPKRVLRRRESRRDEENAWLRWAHLIMRRPVVGLATALVILIAFALPVLGLQLGPGTNEKLPEHIEATQGLRVISSAVGSGALNPTQIVVDTGEAGGAANPENQSAVARLISELNRDPEVGHVYYGTGAGWVAGDGRYMRVEAVGKSDPGVEASEAFIARLRDETIPAVSLPESTEALVGGLPAFNVDFLDKTYSAFPWLVLGVLALTYVLLLRAFRSLLLPLKAIVLNLLSVGAAYGLLVAAFKWGLGEPFGLIEYEQITGWIPVFLFAVLFGLSMDYEVFLVSRMREEWDATKDNARAVAEGLAKTGRLVTAAGLIMFAAFMGLVVGSFVDLQQFGFGLAIAILVDVTIIRALLLPSAMTLFGRWNWWLPAGVAGVFRVEPSPLEEAPPKAPAATPVA